MSESVLYDTIQKLSVLIFQFDMGSKNAAPKMQLKNKKFQFYRRQSCKKDATVIYKQILVLIIFFRKENISF